MMRLLKEKTNATKGMSSAVLLSIAIHAALFFLAGMLVVFTVVKKREVEFEPPQAVERPKMKLKKPKVKVKKTARPKKTKHILAKINPVNTPEIQLPEMTGIGGDGLGDGIVGGFDMMPDLSETSFYGENQSIGNDFVGTFYDFKRDRKGRTISVDTTGDEWRSKIYRFLQSGWKTTSFSRFYQSPRKLFATSVAVPITVSSFAPIAFGDKDAVGALWAVHYQGQLTCPASHPEGITFRFWGMADEFMAVRVNNKMVLALDWPFSNYEGKIVPFNLWNSDSADNRKYWMGNQRAVVGNWIKLEPGEAVDMEILIGDNGGVSCFFLAVQEKGVEYPRGPQGNPILPVFKTAEPSRDFLEAVYKYLPEDEICLTNGPVFCDYETVPKTRTTEVSATVDPSLQTVNTTTDVERTWNLNNGHTLIGEFVNIFGGKIVVKDKKSKMLKIPKDLLSAEDIRYAELETPPSLDVNFLKNFEQQRFNGGFYDVPAWARPPEQWGYFGVQIKQTSPGEYSHSLRVELFAIGSQRSASEKYILLDHQCFDFNPAEENGFYEFRSDKKVVMLNFRHNNCQETLGEKYAGYLVTITDERGKVIEIKSSSKWLPKKLEELKKLSIGNYFNEDCKRVFPERPTTTRY